MGKKKQEIKCDVFDCAYCICDQLKCSLKEVVICNQSDDKKKEATMCNSYKKNLESVIKFWK